MPTVSLGDASGLGETGCGEVGTEIELFGVSVGAGVEESFELVGDGLTSVDGVAVGIGETESVVLGLGVGDDA
jgi:hypothetical protein